MMPKMPAFTPMPRVRTPTAVSVKPRCLRSRRALCRRSCQIVRIREQTACLLRKVRLRRPIPAAEYPNQTRDSLATEAGTPMPWLCTARLGLSNNDMPFRLACLLWSRSSACSARSDDGDRLRNGRALLRHVTLGLPNGAPGLVLVERHPAFDADARSSLWILASAEQLLQ